MEKLFKVGREYHPKPVWPWRGETIREEKRAKVKA